MKSQFFIISAVAIASILILLPLYLNPEELRIVSVKEEIGIFNNIKAESKDVVNSSTNNLRENLRIFKKITELEVKKKGVVANINYTNTTGGSPTPGAPVNFTLDLYSQEIKLHDEYQVST